MKKRVANSRDLAELVARDQIGKPNLKQSARSAGKMWENRPTIHKLLGQQHQRTTIVLT